MGVLQELREVLASTEVARRGQQEGLRAHPRSQSTTPPQAGSWSPCWT